MKKLVIGYLFNDKKKKLEEKKFIRIAKKLGIEIIFFNLFEKFNIKELENDIKKCQIFFNDSGEPIVQEFAKSLELMGKKVVETPEIAYYPEDKWIFYLECKKNKIPTPETILLPSGMNNTQKELEEFSRWPVVIKKVYGCRGEFVERAKNLNEAKNIIKKFWKGEKEDRDPLIAQEYINSDSYRVTLIDGKIVQTALKKRSGWKASGCNVTKLRKFKLDKNAEKISKQIARISKIKICGVDLAKKDGKWLAIEVNACPSLKLFDCEHDKLIETVLLFLKKEAHKKINKQNVS